MAGDIGDNLTARLVAEFTGTFLLVFTVGCNILGQTPVWAGVSIACVLMVMIYSFGLISGGHFNPAVSVALAIAKAMGQKNMKNDPENSLKEAAMYSGVQIGGAILAGLSYFALFGHTFNLAPAKEFSFAIAGVCELLYTFMLCFVVFNVAVASKVKSNEYYGLAIGFVVVAGAYGAGAVSGGCFNPAVALGIDLTSVHLGFGHSLIYVLFELVGAALAAVVYKVVHPIDFDQSEIIIDEGQKITVSALVSEFLGTFFLVLTVGLNVLGKSPAGAFSIAASLMCMIYALGPVSGANFNPAVTWAIFVSKFDEDMQAKKLGMYIGAQILGGILAGFTYAGIYSGQTFALGPGAGYNMYQVMAAEIAFTLVLCLVVLCVAVVNPELGYPKTSSKTMFGLAIGSCVTVGGFAIGSISGGSLNPAVSIGIETANLLNGGTFSKALLYSLFELVGASAAAGIAMQTHKKLEAMPK
mmetsp:Transcript_73174/g.114545  ORF Transcript_73174/g.114545 Transcript_73174/m.114545 type:complete len:470 (+) Transcript_73174:59-1468(+)